MRVAADPVGKLTRAKVRKIANQEIDKRAPGLSVAHANTATNATNATNADNANNLGGLGSDVYLNRVARGIGTGTVGLPAGVVPTQIAPTVSITVPSGHNFVHYTGVASFFSGATTVILWVQQDAVCQASGFGFDNRSFDQTNQNSTVTTDHAVAVTAATHTFRLCGASSGASSTTSQSLTVETVQRGSTGGTSFSPSGGGAAPDADGDVTTPK